MLAPNVAPDRRAHSVLGHLLTGKSVERNNVPTPAGHSVEDFRMLRAPFRRSPAEVER